VPPLSFTQRLFTRLMPGRAADMERQSREWFVVCPRCGVERSIWDMGGIRYGAKSKGKRVGSKCRSCGKRSMHRVEHRPGAAG
jgi:ribosomal protein L37E